MSDTMSSSTAADTDDDRPLVAFRAVRSGPHCPFGNPSVSFALRRGGCVRLAGSSGLGKTTLASVVAGLSSAQSSSLRRLDVSVEECRWDPALPASERCGVLFQQTTLIDALTVAGNVCLALESCPSSSSSSAAASPEDRDRSIKSLLETVGLDYARDANKRPTELSGGMARRASLALQLAQRKHVIVLDEPFAGLDRDAALGVARELVRLRKERGTAFLLISHEPDVADVVMDGGEGKGGNETVTLDPPSVDVDKSDGRLRKPDLFGRTFSHRFYTKLIDYVLYSLPLILCTFVATGLAISMLSSDILRRIDVTDQVVGIVDKEVRPLLKLVTGEDTANPLTMMMIKMKVRSMLDTAVPDAKATLYALGMAKLFVLEVGPLVTALLLAGRIGGSYAGDVATMQATAQNKLLRTLGIDPIRWTLVPALAAAWLASPILTVAGTVLALFLGGLVGPTYGIGSWEGYVDTVWDAVFPPLRLRGLTSWDENDGWEHGGKALVNTVGSFLPFDVRCTFSDSYKDAVVEVVTHPVPYHLIKSCTFVVIVLLVAEAAARRNPDLTPRHVPGVITSSVVIGSLLVIVADWGFSQLLLQRQ